MSRRGQGITGSSGPDPVCSGSLQKDFVHIAKDLNRKAHFSGLVKGNKMLGEILFLMKEDTTESEIVRKMREKYEAPEGKIEADVHKVVAELRKIGAIEGK